MFEHPGRLLDEPPALLGGGLQDLVQLPLSDDHMHLPAQTGVGEQLLDVQQPTFGAVDGVLRTPGAEHSPADGDLGVVDGQSTVGVVDGQTHRGPPQRLAFIGTGEDHILHGPAAQGLRPLLPHDPGQGVDHIGLS